MKKLIALTLLLSFAFIACEDSEDAPSTDPQKIGIVGEWYSSGDNVSVLLTTYFAIDSIYAKFETNNTYIVESYADGAMTTYAGTYTQEKSGTGTIWNITFFIGLEYSISSITLN